MDFSAASMSGPPFGHGPELPSNSDNRIIGIDITFTCPGTEPIRRSFFRSEWTSVHLGREPVEISGVANAFVRSDVVPPVMSRKHAEIMFTGDTPQVVDIGSYHGTYFRASGQRLVANRSYQLADGLVLEFGKSVTKDDKAHEPLLATIKFIRESDQGRFQPAAREQSLLSPPSPPRRYSVPSDSDDEDEDETDEDDMSSRSDIFEYDPNPIPSKHIDLTLMSDDSPDGDGIECLGFGFTSGMYVEESVSDSDMSESEYEDDVGKVVTPPSGIGHGASAFGENSASSSGMGAPAPISSSSSVHGLITPPVELVAPAPIPLPRLPRIEAALSGLEYSDVGFYAPMPVGLPDFGRPHIEDSPRGPAMELGYGEDVRSEPSPETEQMPIQLHRESEVSRMLPEPLQEPRAPDASEQVRTLKAELAVAQTEITELKRELEQSLVEKDERAAIISETPTIAEAPAPEDVPARIANIENMMSQLATVGDSEMCEHRTAVLDMLAQLSAGIEALRIRIGYEAPQSIKSNKRKRTEEDEHTESEQAQSSPAPVPAPVTVPSPSKRLRFTTPAVSALAGGAAVWGALAFGYL